MIIHVLTRALNVNFGPATMSALVTVKLVDPQPYQGDGNTSPPLPLTRRRGIGKSSSDRSLLVVDLKRRPYALVITNLLPQASGAA